MVSEEVEVVAASFSVQNNSCCMVVAVAAVAVAVVVVVVLIVPSGHKLPLVVVLDFLSKKYWVLLSLIHFVISCFPQPCISGPCIAACFVCQFIITVSCISSVHLVSGLPPLLPSLSLNIKSFSKIYQFSYCG
jgi:hypothetical protein